MNTSERLSGWIVDLKLYEEFWASVPAECRKSGEIASRAEYEKLAIEFLKEHFRNLSGIIGTAIPPEPQTYTTTGELPPGEYKRPATPDDFVKPAKQNPLFDKLATRLRKQAQAYAQDAHERKALLEAHELARAAAEYEPPKKPTDPWGAPTDTRGYPEK